MKKINILGIDTSNYTTSIALVEYDKKEGLESYVLDSPKVLSDIRIPIKVKPSKTGIRQSEAHFQHINNLPEMLKELREYKIDGISVSSAPRNVEGSYMPVFQAGLSFGKALATVLHIPFFTFSHQEGHIASYSLLNNNVESEFVSFHLSGGTNEILKITNELKHIEIIGGTKDISYGQVLDRVGVSMGYHFPCGNAVDKLALSYEGEYDHILKDINIVDLEYNLSGIETQCSKIIDKIDPMKLSFELMKNITNSLKKLVVSAKKNTGLSDVIFVGGVSKSEFIRRELNDLNVKFNEYALDNAVGIALLGGVSYGHEAH